MSSLRRLGLPLLVVAVILAAFEGLGPHRPLVVEASAPGAICSVQGPAVIAQGQTALYAFRIQDNRDNLFDEFGFEDTFSVRLDNISGNSKITHAMLKQHTRLDTDIGFQGFGLKDWVEVSGPSNLVRGLRVGTPQQISFELLEVLHAQFGYVLESNPCGPKGRQIYEACITDGFCSEFIKNTTPAQREAWANAVDEAMRQGMVFCLDIKDVGHDALIKAGAPVAAAIGRPDPETTNQFVGGIDAYFLAVCNFNVPSMSVGPILDDVGFFAVTCIEPGEFDLSISDMDDGQKVVKNQGGHDFLLKDQLSTFAAHVVCRGAPSEKSEIIVFPEVLEIVPAPGSVSNALVLVHLLDEKGQTPASGYRVIFAVDRCSVKTGGIDTAEKLFDAVNIFAALNSQLPATARAVEESAAARAPLGRDRKQASALSFDIGDPVVSRAGAIVSCNYKDAPDATPGIATVRVIIQIKGREDVVLSKQIRVVGPPAVVALEAAPATVRCGEKIAFAVHVRDAANQPVSDNTRVEIVTNAGGVLAGTGAVAGNEGAVTPISSTVASTVTLVGMQDGREVVLGGVARFFLITSELHTGPYQVVAVSGGSSPDGKSFSTPTVSEHLTVQCFTPQQVAQTQAAPPGQSLSGQQSQTAATQGASSPSSSIRPPNTGDAGIASGF